MKALCGALLALVVVASAHAQTYPTRPVRLIVGIAPGGAPDIVARVLAERISRDLGAPIVVENHAGSNGNIAADIVAKAAPDGHTLLLGQDAIIAINPHLYRMPFDSLKDLIPIATVAKNQFVLAINPTLPAKTFAEFIDYARKSKPSLAYASGGNGSQHHLSMELLKQRAGIDLLHVPFKSGAPATTATVAGDTAAMFAGTSVAPQIRAGKLRAIATTGPKRSPEFPDLPTIGEFYPGYEIEIWLGIFAPVGTPASAVQRLRSEIAKALSDEQVAAKFRSSGGLEPLVTSPDEFVALIRRDHDKYGKVVKDVGVKVD
ncbi:MAG TPA: tripartite tricarboxylate transporter substrate binding protein [Casimicrobiaceae bacterium]|nr:tripartite tricarboxylate transporter substrate binding protein [Casimicrobiaceae bacterium]